MLGRREEAPLSTGDEAELAALLNTPEARRRLVAHQLLSGELAGRLAAPGSALRRPRPRPRLALTAGAVLVAAGAAFAMVARRGGEKSHGDLGRVVGPPPKQAGPADRTAPQIPRFATAPTPEAPRAEPLRSPTAPEVAALQPRGFQTELAFAPAATVFGLRGQRPTKEGFLLKNEEAWECAASQRVGLDTLMVGSVLGRADLVAEGWRTIDATFLHQHPDGSFGDAAICAAVYLGQLVVALDTLERGPLARANADRIARLTPQLQRAARYLARPDSLGRLKAEVAIAPTPDFAAASALASLSARLRDPALLATALHLADSGVAKQRPDGSFIHQRGVDSAFQVYRTLQLHWLMATLPLDRYSKAARKAGDWLRGRVLADGRLDLTGNTRNTPCDPTDGSGCRRPHFRAADLRWVLLLHAARFDPTALALADLVYRAELAAKRASEKP